MYAPNNYGMSDESSFMTEPPRSSCNGGIIAIIVIVIVLLVVGIVLAVVGTRGIGSGSDAENVIVVSPKMRLQHATAAAAPPEKSVRELSDEAGVRQMLAGDEPVVVVVYAPWCGYSKKMLPVLDEVAQAGHQVKIVKITDANAKGLVEEMGIRGFPTLLANFGEKRYVGYRDVAQMTRLLAEAHGANEDKKKKRVTMAPSASGAFGGVIELGSEAQARTFLASGEPALLMIHAEWCGYCKKMLPVLEELAPKFPRVKIAKILSDECKGLCEENGVAGYPTMLTNFGTRRKLVGYMPSEAISKVLVQATN
jgi:thioredoxin 1